MKKIVGIILLLMALTCQATVYTTYQAPGGGNPGITWAYTTNQFCRLNVYNQCWWQNATVGYQVDGQPWVLNPPTVLWQQPINDDIIWGANYLNANGILWRLGQCLQARTVYNVNDICLH